MKKFIHRTRGAAFANYAILVGLIATISVAATALTGSKIRDLFVHASNGVAGEVVGTDVALNPAGGDAEEAVDPFVEAYFKGAGSTEILASATSVSPQFYSETEPGDVLVAFVMHRSELVVPSSWQTAASQKTQASDQWLSVLTSTHMEDDDASATFYQLEANRFLAHVVTISGTNPQIVSTATGSGSSSVRPGLPYQTAKDGAVLLGAASDVYALTGGSEMEYSVEPGWTLTTPPSTQDNRLAVAVSSSTGQVPGEWVSSTSFDRTNTTNDWSTAFVQITSDGVAETEAPEGSDIPEFFAGAATHMFGSSDISELTADDAGDMWRFTLPETQDVQLVLSPEDHGDGALTAFRYFKLYDESENEIFSIYKSGGGDLGRVMNELPAGDYYMLVTSGGTGGYKLTSTPLTYDAPNEFETAALHTFGGSDSSDLITGDTGDMWRFTVPATQDVQFLLSPEDQGEGALTAHRYLKLYDVNRSELFNIYKSGGGDLGRVMNQLPAGDYYMQVTSGGTGGYALTSTPLTYDAPNEFETAALHTFGGSDSSDLISGDTGDMWRFTVPATQDVQFLLSPEDHGDGSLTAHRYLRLYDANQNELFEIYKSGGGDLGRVVNQLAAGDYYMRVTSGGTGGYALTSTPLGHDVSNDFASAEAHDFGTSDRSDLITGDTGDMWRFTVPATQDVQFLLSPEDQGDGSLTAHRYLRLYDANQNELFKIYKSGGGDLGRVVNQLPAGDYYMRVTSGGTGGYALTTTPLTYDAPNDIENAAAHSFGSSTSSDLITGDEGDMWRFELASTQDVQLTLDPEDQGQGALTAFRYFYLYDASGSQLFRIYTSSSSSLARTMEQLPAGTYYMRVSSGGSGGYRLTTAPL